MKTLMVNAFQVKKEFFAMLREHKDIDRHSHWSECKKKLESDWRYRVVESASAREDWFRDYVRVLKDERKKEKEKDKDHRHREKDHKTDKKDRDRKESEKGKDSKSMKEKTEKDSSKEKKQRRNEVSAEENGKDKKEAVVEKESGEIEESDEKSVKKDNDVSVMNDIIFASFSILLLLVKYFFFFSFLLRKKRGTIILIQRRTARNRKENEKDERKLVFVREKGKCREPSLRISVIEIKRDSITVIQKRFSTLALFSLIWFVFTFNRM